MPSDESREIVEMLRSTAAPIGFIPTVAERREALDSMGALFAVPDEVEVRRVEIAGIAGERFSIASAPPSDSGLMLYLHGGAYTAGSLASHRAFTARLARACGREVLSIDYRLAPEHPFPAGLDDARAVYDHLLGDGLSPEQLVVAGDSAGGGLATAMLLSARDAGSPMPAGAVLLSPWLDLTLSGASIAERAEEDPLLRADALEASAIAYAGTERNAPLVSPVFANLAGLPPMLILVGTAEILLDDSRRFATGARDAGGEVDLDVEADLIHVWPFIDGLPESGAALDRIAGWVDARLTS